MCAHLVLSRDVASCTACTDAAFPSAHLTILALSRLQLIYTTSITIVGISDSKYYRVYTAAMCLPPHTTQARDSGI